MDLESIAALGEAVGGLAVLATLLYLSFQLKQSNRIATAVAQQNVLAQAGLTHDAARSREFAELRLKMRTVDYDSLDPIEKEQLEAHLYQWMNIWISVQTSFDQGLISKEVLDGYVQDVRNEINRFPALKPRMVNFLKVSPVLADWAIFEGVREISPE